MRYNIHKMAKDFQDIVTQQMESMIARWNLHIAGSFINDGKKPTIAMQIYFDQDVMVRYGQHVEFTFLYNNGKGLEGERIIDRFTIKTRDQYDILIDMISSKPTKYVLSYNDELAFIYKKYFYNYEQELFKKRHKGINDQMLRISEKIRKFKF